MKRILTATLTLFLCLQFSAVVAQNQPSKKLNRQRPDITQFVSNLSDSQKSKLESITQESRQRVDMLREQQKAVRDSIARYMDRDDNQSKYLYPLFDREAKLQAEISREMYATKVRIEEVLNKEQRQEFREASKKHRQKEGKKR